MWFFMKSVQVIWIFQSKSCNPCFIRWDIFYMINKLMCDFRIRWNLYIRNGWRWLYISVIFYNVTLLIQISHQNATSCWHEEIFITICLFSMSDTTYLYIYFCICINIYKMTLEVTLTKGHILELRFLYGRAEAWLASHFPKRYFYLLHE